MNTFDLPARGPQPPHRQHGARVLSLLLTAVASWAAQAANGSSTAIAGSSIWATPTVTDAGEATWAYSNPTAKDKIYWFSGANTADTQAFPQVAVSNEVKFTVTTTPSGTTVAGKPFTGFGPISDTSTTGGTKATTSGAGSSALKKGSLFGTNAVAKWTTTATGSIGTTPPGPWSYDSTSIGKDPWGISAADLASQHGDNFSLFFSASLSGDFSPEGDIGLSVSYQTAAGTLNLLTVRLDATGATLSQDSVPQLTFYKLTSLDEGPTEIAANIVSLSQIKTMLDADVLPDHSLDAPLYLGMVLHDLPKPTVDLGDGTVADLHVDSYAHDLAHATAVVPEPATSRLLGVGLLGLVGLSYGRRRKRTTL